MLLDPKITHVHPLIGSRPLVYIYMPIRARTMSQAIPVYKYSSLYKLCPELLHKYSTSHSHSDINMPENNNGTCLTSIFLHRFTVKSFLELWHKWSIIHRNVVSNNKHSTRKHMISAANTLYRAITNTYHLQNGFTNHSWSKQPVEINAICSSPKETSIDLGSHPQNINTKIPPPMIPSESSKSADERF